MMLDQKQDPSSPFPLNNSSCPPLTEWMSPHVGYSYHYVNETSSSAETSCGHPVMISNVLDLSVPPTCECHQSSIVNLTDPHANVSESMYLLGHVRQDFLSASQSDMLPAYNDCFQPTQTGTSMNLHPGCQQAACRQDAWGQHVWSEGDDTSHGGTTPGGLMNAGYLATSAGGFSCDRPSYGQVVLMPCGLDNGARLSYAGVAMLGPQSSLSADVQQKAEDVPVQDLQTDLQKDQTFSYLPAGQVCSRIPEQVEFSQGSSDEDLAGLSAAMNLSGDIPGSTTWARRQEEPRELEEAAGGPIVIVCARKGSLTGKNKVEISYETLTCYFDQSMQEASKKLVKSLIPYLCSLGT